MKSIEFKIDGMHCHSCEKLIERQAKSMKGIVELKADYVRGVGIVTYDEGKTNLDKIFAKINGKGYTCRLVSDEAGGGIKSAATSLGLIVVLIGAYLLLRGLNLPVPALTPNTSVILLFAIGLLTGFHCVAMCGGFVISYSSKETMQHKGLNLRSHLEYGFGKTLSYAIMGGIFGLVGSFLMITPTVMAAATILGGLFLILFGMNMLDLFNWFKRFRFKAPVFIDNLISKRRNSSPLIIGLLTGLMVYCGPLQAVYVFAAASGSPYLGALYLAVFSLGTLPVLLGFGVFTSFIGFSLKAKIVKYSGVLVILLGLLMMSRGADMYGGYGTTPTAVQTYTESQNSTQPATQLDSNKVQVVQMTMAHGFTPDNFALTKGKPVKWLVDNQNTFTVGINVPKLGLKLQVNPGLNTYDFTPTKSGTIPFSCWMDVFHGTFTVKDN